MKLVNHIEKYVGEISYGILRNHLNLSVAVIENKPISNLKTFVTLGLNQYDIGYKSRFELLFVCKLEIKSDEISSMLLWLAERIIVDKKIILCGEVIFLSQNISISKMKAFYVAMPFYFDDDFQVVNYFDNDVVFPLLIPIYESEAKLIQQKGWRSFENFLYQKQIDNLYDLNRQVFHW